MASATAGAISRGLTSVSYWTFLASLILAPLPFGLAEPAYQSVWIIVMCASLALGRICQGTADQVVLPGIVVAGLAACVACTLLFVDGSPLQFTQGWGSLHWVSFELSLASSGAIFLLLASAALAALHGQKSERANLIAKAIVWSAAAFAIIGLLQSYVAPSELLWIKRPGYDGFVLGTFVNRNTAAAYFGLAMIIASSFLMAKLDDAESFDWSEKKSIAVLVFDVLAIAVLAVALVQTGSRAGTAFSFIGLLASICLMQVGTKQSAQVRTRVFAASGIFCLVVAVAGTQLADRFSALSLVDPSRQAVAHVGLEIALKEPWTGHGPGSFVWLFPQSRPLAIPVTNTWERVHNTYLELSIEWGLVAAVLLVAIFLATIIVPGLGLMRGKTKSRPLMASACGAAIAASLHASIDFPLLVPGYGVIFAALASMGLIATLKQKRQQPDVALATGDDRPATTGQFAPKHSRPAS